MTPEEARRTLDRLYQYVSTEVQQALDVADKAMEKQIPMEVGTCVYGVDDVEFFCPVCEADLELLDAHNFCANCGQKLDWRRTTNDT